MNDCISVSVLQQLAEHPSICVDDQGSAVLRYATGSRARYLFHRYCVPVTE